MLIHEAVKKALEQDKKISRDKFEGRIWINPKGKYGMLDVQAVEQAPCAMWNPSPEDLMANDWYITE
jgi:Protein of unknown function (DUF2829).